MGRKRQNKSVIATVRPHVVGHLLLRSGDGPFMRFGRAVSVPSMLTLAGKPSAVWASVR